MSWTQRGAGVLLHISSLPSRQLGADALRFMDVMAQAGLRVWQILPVGPATKHHNPFEPASAFAGDPALVPMGAGDGADEDSFEAFQREHADWLPEWALFSALEHELGDLPWWEWPPPLRDREPPALEAARERLVTHIEHACLAQFAFERAWSGLRAQAHARGIRIFGDVPLFVSHDSAEVWTHRELFEVDPTGQCAAVVGVPPDAFSETGQFWGYPPYRWEVMAQTGFAWWKRRFEIQARRFDLVRLDHFRGFAAWWRIPQGARSAAEGAWTPGPGRGAIDALAPVLGGAQLVAEDLGVITEDVIAMRQALGIPGMRVLQFAFDGNPHNPHLPASHGPDTICYTGTHDNDTTLGWWRSAPAHERENVARFLGQAEPAMPHALVDCALASPAPLSIVPMQDLLELGAEARMNRPGVAEGNWRWRFDWAQLSADFGPALRARLAQHGRLP